MSDTGAVERLAVDPERLGDLERAYARGLAAGLAAAAPTEERAATQRRIDLTLKSVARYIERTNPRSGRPAVNALIEAQADVAALATGEGS